MRGLFQPLSRIAARAVGALARQPFPRLVNHFVRRILRSGADKRSGDSELGAGPLLGLLIAPGAFYCFLLMEKSSSLMSFFMSRTKQDLLTSSIPDKLLLISISMAITGFVCVLKWDRLLLDSQDYINLAPLPVRRGRILTANAVSVLLIVVFINGAVNVASCVLFPALVSASSPDGSVDFWQFFRAHVTVVSLASSFTFLFVMAALSSTTLLAGQRLAPAATTVVRVALMVGFFLLVPGTMRAGSLWRSASGIGWLACLPSLWFLDLYQQMQSRGPVGPTALSSLAWRGPAVALAVAIISCGLLSVRQFGGSVLPQARSATTWLIRPLVAGMRWLVPAAPFESAVREFTIFGLLRNDPHRLVLLVALGVGWATAAQYSDRSPTTPLIPAYLVVLALSIAFQLPTELSANWIFRVTLDRAVYPIGAAVRQAATILAAAWVLLPTAAFLILSGREWRECLLLLVLVGCMNWAHLEVVFGRWRYIPFTRPHVPFRQNLPVRCILQVLAFAIYVWIGGRLYPWIEEVPAKLLPLVLLCLYLRWWNRSQRESELADGDLNALLSFENHNEDDVQTLGLG